MSHSSVGLGECAFRLLASNSAMVDVGGEDILSGVGLCGLKSEVGRESKCVVIVARSSMLDRRADVWRGGM